MIQHGRFLLPVILILLHGWHAEAAVLEAGAARADITPPLGCPMWGYSARKDRPCTGVRDPLEARALVLAAGTDRMALVGLDLGRAPPRAVTNSLRARLKTAVGIEHLFLVGSHTHHGPVLEVDCPAEKPYLRQLEDKLFELVVTAAKARQPARLGIAAKEVPLNRNRQWKGPNPPVDRELLVLRVEDKHGKLLAHAVNFAAHPTILNAADLRWSAEWPGAMARIVEKETGAPCLFLQGAAGDLSPNRGNQDTPDTFGQAMSKEVLALLRGARCDAPDNATLQFAEEDFTFTPRVDLSNPLVNAALGSSFFPALIAYYEREYRTGVRPHLTVALLNGRVGFVGVSGEVFCAHSLRLKKRARLDHLFFLGYCNDYQQYFPTIEAVAQGGYGTEPYTSPAQVGAGERIMDKALIHLYQMRGRLK